MGVDIGCGVGFAGTNLPLPELKAIETGSGNNFIELQEDEDGMLGIMIHSGSRNFGKQVCNYLHQMARR